MLDSWVLHTLYGMRTVTDTLVMIDVSELGSVLAVLGLAAITAILLVRARDFVSTAALMLAVGTTAVIVTGLKYIIARPRPDAFFQAYPEIGHSFPSWHAGGSAALYLSLAYIIAQHIPTRRRWIVYVIGVALTILIGFTRLYLGVHYASDVIAGWMIGTVCAYLSFKYAPKILELPIVKKYVG